MTLVSSTGSLPGTMVAHKLMQVIKSKCSPEEALSVLKELPDPQMDEDGKHMWHPLQFNNDDDLKCPYPPGQGACIMLLHYQS